METRETGVRDLRAPHRQTNLVEYLPGLIEAIQDAARDEHHLEACIEALLKLPGNLIRGCSVLQSRPFEPFLVIGRFGEADVADRSWIRWPLQRLFVMRRAACLEYPLLGARALALPFTHHGIRTVVIATLEPAKQSSGAQLVVSILSAISLEPEPLARDIQTIGTPEFLWFGNEQALKSRVETILEKRGWELACYSRVSALMQKARTCAVPVVCVDPSVPHPALVIRALRSALGSRVTIITVGAVWLPPSDLQVLVDEHLTTDGTDGRILNQIKVALRRSAASRIRETQAAIQRARAIMDDTDTIDALASESARAASRFVDGWANVQLVDSSGGVSLGEYPAAMHPIATILPDFFLDTRPLLKTVVDDEFYDFVSSDELGRDRLQSLGLKSGACIPLSDGERVLGTLVAGSQQSRLERNELEALLQFAAYVAARAKTLSNRMSAGQYFNSRSWTFIREPNCEIRVYRSSNSLLIARLIKLRADCNVLVISPPELAERISALLEPIERFSREPRERLVLLQKVPGDAPFAVAFVYGASGTVTFAGRGIPPPVLWNVAGPHGEIVSDGSACAGVISLTDFGCAYLGDTEMLPFLGRSPSEIRADIDRSQPEGTLACITMRSLAAV